VTEVYVRGTGGLRRVALIMGMPVAVHLADPMPRTELMALAEDAFAWFRRVDRLFSTYRPDSEVCRLRDGRARAAHPEVAEVLDRCARLREATRGYFDVRATGRLDPSCYVRGWAVQAASDRLLARGAGNHHLDAGGVIRVRGGPRPGRPWRIGVRHPWRDGGPCWVLSGRDLAVATSVGDAPGERVIDPHTRRPALGLESVTVAGPDLGTADAYATAALAMGLDALDWLPDVPGYSCLIVTGAGGTYASPGLTGF
jgi:thiamine biosynthesis lipoprotein